MASLHADHDIAGRLQTIGEVLGEGARFQAEVQIFQAEAIQPRNQLDHI
jgi:hypothetical protein